ncbi:transcriptional regulator with XRE-family HTH domain [Lachnospiraceae bacterium PM6-15]|uniref:helix-turn-helix domain-containing protein n=1 Tax=Ohessyouella blattaphilus TaxID=2949333 RepID=UPI003E1FA580
MGPKTITGSEELAKSIKKRRNELGMTIAEAAALANVGTKTWSRYEAGASIRKDKITGVYKTLKWPMPYENAEPANETKLDINQYMTHEAWSTFILNTFGKYAATSFAIGSDILLDELQEDIEALSLLPRGTHIGELNSSWIDYLMPPQFLTRYDYDLLYALRCTVIRLRKYAHSGIPLKAHSVIEELAFYLITEESRSLMEELNPLSDSDTDSIFEDYYDEENDTELYSYWDEWIFDLFDDADILTYLYSDYYLDSDHNYHFDHWFECQFYAD